MRNLKENSNIIETFMTRGAEHFYLPYCLEGDEFIKQIHIPNKEVREVAKIAEEYLGDEVADLRNKVETGAVEVEKDTDTVKHFCQHIILSGLLELKKEKPTENELKLYQYVADIIVGQPNIMYKLVAEIAENDDFDEETIEMAEFNVYNAIFEMFVNADKQAKFADESEEY